MEEDKIERFLGVSPNAGFDRAVEWMRSNDPLLRQKAGVVFADIDDEPSLANLGVLMHDPDPSVRASAHGQLQIRQREQSTFAAQNE